MAKPIQDAGVSGTRYYLISYPRSGHHMLEKMLARIFTLNGHAYSYCEFYNCCRTTPCKHGYLFQKNHDSNLQFSQSLGNYIILYRSDSIRQLDAIYRYKTSVRYGRYKQIITPNAEWWTSADYIDGVIHMILEKRLHHADFLKKWVGSNANDILAIEYYDFLKKPRSHLHHILNHLTPNFHYTENSLDMMLDEMHLGIRNHMPDDCYSIVEERLNDLDL